MTMSFNFSPTSSIFDRLQVENCDINSRLVVDKNTMVNSGLKATSSAPACTTIIKHHNIPKHIKWRAREYKWPTWNKIPLFMHTLPESNFESWNPADFRPSTSQLTDVPRRLLCHSLALTAPESQRKANNKLAVILLTWKKSRCCSLSSNCSIYTRIALFIVTFFCISKI